MSEFYTILPPPQSVETLDLWGPLDSLRWSFDSDVWRRAGIYGLIASEGGESGESLDAVRVRLLSMRGGAAAGGAMQGVKAASVYDISCQASARSDGAAELCRVMLVEALAEAKSEEGAELGRVLLVDGSGGAFSGEVISPTYKGWDWNEKEKPSAPVWGQEATEPSLWVQKQRNAAEWAAQSVTAKDWTQKHGGMATWQ
jgi:hypothetical protein